MRIEVQTTLTKALNQDYVTYVMRRADPTKRIVRDAAIVLLQLLAVTNVLLDPREAAGWALLILAIVVGAMLLFLPRLAAFLGFRKLPPGRLTQRFTFSDDFFEVANENDFKYQGRAVVRYDGLEKAVEDKEAFYLFFEKGRAYLAAKADFPEGGVEELRARLAEVLGTKSVRL